jgi:hypothetical protein
VVASSGGGGMTVRTNSTYGGLFFADGTTGDEQYRGYVQYNHNFSGLTDAMIFGTAGTGKMTLDSSGNLGLGVTPSAWRSTTRAMQIGSTSSFQNFDNGGSIAVSVGNNFFWNSSDQAIYIQSKHATNYFQNSGQHVWQTAASGTAGNAISFTQAMTLDASGRLGVATTTPGVDLEIGANTGTVRALSVRYSTIPTYLSSTFDGASGLATVSSNAYNTSNGSASWSSFGNTNYGCSAIQLAANNGSSDIRLLTAAAGNTNPTERARITSGGDLLVGTTSGSGRIRMKQSADAFSNTFTIENFGNTNTWSFLIGSDNDLYLGYNGTNRGSFNNSTGIYTAVSDQRLKKNIAEIQYGLSSVLALRPVSYLMKDQEENASKTLGFIAQEVNEIVPESVFQMRDDFYGMDKEALIPVLVKAIQELKAEFDAYKASHP